MPATDISAVLMRAALVLFTIAGPLAAQVEKNASDYVLTVRADREDAIYRQQEPVQFTIKLLRGSEPVHDAEVQWTISKDGVPPAKSGKVKLNQGIATVTGQLDEPGFLQCRVGFTADKQPAVIALGGAAVDPLQIKPSLPVPDDFDAYWAVQKKELAVIPINARLTAVPSPDPSIECFDLQADSIGAPVSGYFARPKDAKAKSLPTILTVHGAGVRSSSLAAAVNWAKQGCLALDINAHGIPNGKPDAFYADLSRGELKDYRNRGHASRDTIYFRGMFLRLVRAIDFLTAQPEWDGRNVVVQGSSQGGAQAIVAAGIDSRVTFFAAGVPAMCDHTGSAAGRVSGWPKLVPSGDDGKPLSQSLQAARYYDAMNFATRTKAPAIFTVGFIDTTCPPTSVYAVYNNVSGKKTIFNDPLTGHVSTPQASQAMTRAIREHLALGK